jgi:hypothetical protein
MAQWNAGSLPALVLPGSQSATPDVTSRLAGKLPAFQRAAGGRRAKSGRMPAFQCADILLLVPFSFSNPPAYSTGLPSESRIVIE